MSALKDKPWWFTLILGVLAVVLGLVVLFQPARAQGLVGLLAAVYLTAVGLLRTVAALAGKQDSRLPLVRALVALGVGAAIILLSLLNAITPATGFLLLGIGLVVLGGLGLIIRFPQRKQEGFTWGPVIINAVLLGWGLLILLTGPGSTARITVSGWVLIAVGIVGIVWAWLTREKEAAVAEAP
ncbi:MAG: DUF308 domain-containing protein [Caldilineales bacterium]|nr:DUF308 domain-containing protein [Caldilineales bacterium]MDW8316376.1 DUF308 domain-containing protein [Anaerolineae bacterium]